jgi:adenylosuccinate synthase
LAVYLFFKSLKSILVTGCCVIGLQWGDEAKGKLVDLLSPYYDVVVRFQGGANAGHTVVDGNQVYKLHLLPSGILHEKVVNVIAPGVVINPTTLIGEIKSLKDRGVPVLERLRISERSHLVMPWHIIEDRITNSKSVNGESIGTTNRGIGPCYRDKVGRVNAVRASDLLVPEGRDRIFEVANEKRQFLSLIGATQSELLSVSDSSIASLFDSWRNQLSSVIGDTTEFLLDSCERNLNLLFEGAQGALLDIDHGTFPFVTSSNSSGVGVSSGSGVPGRWIDKIIGVCKAYSTRVGGGPFPTELTCDTGSRIRDIGKEFGTTTGRPRRCGWFDAVAARYSARISGATHLSLMMMDVLSYFDELKICVAYDLDGRIVQQMPSNAIHLSKCKPVYEVFEGWKANVESARQESDLPRKAKEYISRIEELVGVPVGIVSIGPDRRQTIFTSKSPSLPNNAPTRA